jgi:hypothetical protein
MRRLSNLIPKRSQFWFISLCILGIVAYFIPWLINPGNGLSFGAYDLAEWASLHPAIRGGNPPFLASLLLRLSLACFGLVIATTLWKQKRGWHIVFIFLVGIALLPPIEFFTLYRDDPNYQQQFALAVITVLVGVSSLALRSPKWTSALGIVCAVVSGISSLLGLIQTYDLMRGFALVTQVGSGGILFVVLNVGIMLLLLFVPPAPLKQTG